MKTYVCYQIPNRKPQVLVIKRKQPGQTYLFSSKGYFKIAEFQAENKKEALRKGREYVK